MCAVDRRLLVSVVASAVLLVACSNDLTVTDEENGQTVQVEVGQTLVLELVENQSTGYLWNVTEEPDDRVLSLLDDDYEVDSDAEGSGGVHTWRYEAVAPGSTSISMENYFQTEPEKQGMDPFSIEVVVVAEG
jgi:inhibitor of cysteine peptidase